MNIMVLNDGETFSELDGCKMITVPDGWSSEEIEPLLRVLRGDEPEDEAEERLIEQAQVVCTFT